MNLKKIKYEISTKNFYKIPGTPIAYWISNAFTNIFKDSKQLSTYAIACKGLDTCDNNRFVRFWPEVEIKKISFNGQNYNLSWFPYCKGGDYRKWYGNLDFVVFWKNDGKILKNLKDKNGKTKSRPQNIRYYFKEGLTFNSISSTNRALRIMNHSIFGGGGNGLFTNKNFQNHFFAFLNSNTAKYILFMLNPTLNFLVGNLLDIPIVNDILTNSEINKKTINNIEISKNDWDCFETSWDFKKHPLI